MSAGKLVCVFIEPRGNAEEACHFAGAQSDGVFIKAHIFKRKRKLVPDLIGDNLIMGILHNKADITRVSVGF